MSKTFTVAEVAAHNQKSTDGLYIIIDGSVYNVTGMPSAIPDCLLVEVLGPSGVD